MMERVPGCVPTNARRTAFITGVSGQDGYYLAEKLLASGWSVHGLVRDMHVETSRDGLDKLVNLRIHIGQLLDGDGIARLIHEIQPDVIFNLAGVSSVYQSWREPYMTSLVSGSAVVSMLEAAWSLQESSGKEVRFFQASSAEIFGHATDLPQMETSAIRPVSPYGAAKALAHHATAVYRDRGLFASTGILYNHESLRRPDTFVTRKITKAVAAIATGSADKLTLGNLDAVRDWGWAPDFIEAISRIAAADEPGDYVVATGESHSVEEFVASAFAAVGIADWAPFVVRDASLVRPSDAPEMRGDITKISSQLGWRPSKTFRGIVEAMVSYDLAQLNRD